MSESTEELRTAVDGAREAVNQAGNLTDQLRGFATELADEAGGHGWQAMSNRMREVGEALEATSEQLTKGATACGMSVEQLGSITAAIPADQVVAYLSESTSQLTAAETAMQAAVQKSDEARTAAAEIRQEGMMQATVNLHGQLMELQQQVGLHRAQSESEQGFAEAYVTKQPGN